MNPFEYVNSINAKSGDVLEDDPDGSLESKYNPYMANRALSYFKDSIMYANDMNMMYDAPKKMQYQYLYYGVPKGRRISKWAKPEKDDDLEVISAIFKCSTKKAVDLKKVLSEKDLHRIRKLKGEMNM